MRLIVLLLTLPLYNLISSTELYAQAPGYLGKRLSIHTDWNTFPALAGPTAGNKGPVFYGETGGGLAFNWRAGAALGYTISRKHQLRLLVNTFKTGMAETYFTPSNNDPTTGLQDQHYLFFNLKGSSVGVGFRGYNLNKSALAPLGIYSGWSLQYTQIKGEILDKQTFLAQGGPHAALGLDLQTNIYSLGYSFGRTHIVADRFMLDYGADLNFGIPTTLDVLNALNSDEVFPAPIESTNDYVRDNNRRYDRDVSWKVFRHSLFYFHIGIGFLIL